jgi:hypothetical protein
MDPQTSDLMMELERPSTALPRLSVCRIHRSNAERDGLIPTYRLFNGRRYVKLGDIISCLNNG